MKPVLNDPDFRAAVGFAKGLAKQLGAKELSPLLLLCGFVLANRAGKLSEKVRELVALDAGIEQAASAAGLKLSTEVAPLDKEAVATDAALRQLFKTGGDSATTLVDALVKSIGSSTSKPSGPKKWIDAITKEEGFSDIIRFACAIARIKGLKEISPELLAAGVFFANRQGLLRKRPSVCAHLAANESSVKALLETHGWTLDESSLNEDGILPLAPSVENALKEVHDDSDPLIAVFNAGIQVESERIRKKRVAYHEAGHAVISKILRPEIGIAQVTIIEKGEADGYVSYDSTCPYLHLPPSREGMLNQVCVALAGRVAEQHKYGHNEIDAGATSDLSTATEMVWDAITKFGLDFEFGPVSLAALSKAGATSSGYLFDQAQRRVQEVLKEGLQRTEMLIREHWTKVEAVAQVLFEKKRLTEDDVLSVMENEPAKGMAPEIIVTAQSKVALQ